MKLEARTRRFAVARRLVAAVCLLAVATAAHALAGNITVHTKMMVGSSRYVNIEGTYTLQAGESALTRVRIITFNSSGALLSTASGSFTSSTWQAGVGDFELAYYYVEFQVRLTDGTFRYFKTATFAW